MRATTREKERQEYFLNKDGRVARYGSDEHGCGYCSWNIRARTYGDWGSKSYSTSELVPANGWYPITFPLDGTKIVNWSEYLDQKWKWLNEMVEKAKSGQFPEKGTSLSPELERLVEL